ncbi:hypothetical protein [Atopococcus tabaci]|uniref:hypothetical protein n=1 Tax=Atopococcus tabaci TaxID=269774 RepID=UPI00240A89B3|nr:hypothetical protein [Atopococcus tabaci]
MDFLFLVFGIISIILIIDGQAVRKQDRIRPLMRQFHVGKDERKTRLAAGAMQAAGALTLVWTLIGFFLYDLLVLPIFIIIYMLILMLVLIATMIIWNKRFKN